MDLYADENGRLLELELIRWGRGSLIAPDWRSLRFTIERVCTKRYLKMELLRDFDALETHLA